MTDLTAQHLKEVVHYDPQTGSFHWLDRPRSQFSTSQGYGAWRAKCLGREAGTPTGQGYRRVSIDNRVYLAHRLAWLYVHGKWPSQNIDHINGDGADNRIANLRDVSNTENHKNLRLTKTNKSGVSGVRRTKYGTWTAAIWDRARVIRLGSFETMAEAVAARKTAERDFGYHPNHGKPRTAS